MEKKTIQLHMDEGFSGFFQSGAAILDIVTEGRYWRTGRILEIRLIKRISGNEAEEERYLAESEEDEYEALLLLNESLMDVKEIITYNGNAFDIPFLRKKYAAYGLVSPFPGRLFHDLYTEYRPLCSILGLPSRKMQDFRDLLHVSDAEDEAALTLRMLPLRQVLRLLGGEFVSYSVSEDEGALYYRIIMKDPVPVRISFHDAIFHMILKDRSADLSCRKTEGFLRRYYTDVKDYLYLPEEGCAVHRSVALFVDRSHTVKAVRQTCFTRFQTTKKFLSDKSQTETYLKSVFSFLLSR